MDGLQPWQWDEPTWRGHVGKIRAGRSLAPESWPGGARVAVALSFDPDHETIPLRDNETGPGKLSQGEFGARAGSPRILKLLQQHSIPATIFFPAVSAMLHPEEVQTYVDAGYEIAIHGWIHERNMILEADDERDLMFRSADVLERMSGKRPVGIRTPSWDFSPSTMAITRELGLKYDSSLMADDEPYEILENGEPTGVVEIPVEWIRDDAVYFAMDRHGPLRPSTAPSTVLEIWKNEFDGARAAGGLLQLTMHPHVIGHRSRMPILGELIEYILESGDAWFATHEEVADYVSGVGDLSRPS